jgi:hypothetical protein
MLSSLPEIILVYFHSANTSQTEAACACFASDAIVHDEGRDHAGTTAIREWIEDTKRKYEPKVEPIRVQESGEKTIVTSSVSGNFPGSPVELQFEFTLRDGKISDPLIQ